MYLVYTFLLYTGLILTLPFYALKFRKYFPTLKDRLGFLKVPTLHHSVWVHAVSVGEVKSVRKLVQKLRSSHSNQPLVLSTITPAGQELAANTRDLADHVFYFPLDLPGAIRRTLDRVNPDLVLIAETEIWPNFLRECRRRGIRVVMVNGRISDRSLPRYRVVRRWLKRVLRGRVDGLSIEPLSVVAPTVERAPLPPVIDLLTASSDESVLVRRDNVLRDAYRNHEAPEILARLVPDYRV